MSLWDSSKSREGTCIGPLPDTRVWIQERWASQSENVSTLYIPGKGQQQWAALPLSPSSAQKKASAQLSALNPPMPGEEENPQSQGWKGSPRLEGIPHHYSWKVHAGHTIHDDENPGIRQVAKAVIETNYKIKGKKKWRAEEQSDTCKDVTMAL